MLKKFKHIVLIDDDETINYYHNYMLEKCKLCEEVLIASDVDKAKELIEGLMKIKTIKSSLILLDINMPKYNGFEFIDRNEEVFQKLSNQNFNLIILTTSGNPHDIEKSKEYALIKEYVQKPITEEILLRLQEDYSN